jgi:hypothetical protein
MKEWLQPVFFFAGRDGIDHLIQIEISKEVGCGTSLVHVTVGDIFEEDASESRGLRSVDARWGRSRQASLYALTHGHDPSIKA